MFITQAEKTQIRARLTLLENAFDNFMAQQANKAQGKWTVEQRTRQSDRMKKLWESKKTQKESV
jgi:hypothetical protein